MAQSKFIVFSDAQPGRDADYNSWYDDVHVPEVTAVPGVTGATRYRVVAAPGAEPTHGYLAIYDIEGDGEAVVADIKARGARGDFRMSDAMNRETPRTFLYERITPRE